jgi:hypothetical protein
MYRNPLPTLHFSKWKYTNPLNVRYIRAEEKV